MKFSTTLLVAAALLVFPGISGADTRAPKIVGGSPAEISDWPGMVAVYNGEGLCGGTLIHPRFVLTAAHCDSGAPPEMWDVSYGSSSRIGYGVKVAKVFTHSQFNMNTFANDIALLKLKNPIKEPIVKIAASNSFPAGSLASVAGWGVTCFDDLDCIVQDSLREVGVKIQDYNKCYLAYLGQGYALPKNTICASDIGKDSCQGDSGGSLRVDQELLGIVSNGLGCAEKEYPGIYTLAPSYRSWIGSYVSSFLGPNKVKVKKTRKITLENGFYLPGKVTSVKASKPFRVKNSCRRVEKKCSFSIKKTKKTKKKSGTLRVFNQSGLIKTIKIIG